jgi:hypothetical protein
MNQQPIVITAKVRKQDIAAVKVDRNESEVITWHHKTVSTRPIKVSIAEPESESAQD